MNVAPAGTVTFFSTFSHWSFDDDALMTPAV